VQRLALGEEVHSPSIGSRLSGKRSPSPSARARHSRKSFFQFFCERLRLLLPSNVTFLFRVQVFPECCARGRWLPRVLVFPEWHALLGTWGRPSSPSATLGEDWLLQVPNCWHSGKCVALGKFCFSRSDRCRIAPWG
jgi:hypothetical protein